MAFMEKKYDVFVSYSRKDYVDEHGNPRENSVVFKLMDFLDKHNISYWFDKNGIYNGGEFVEVITDAITESKMMIFVSSEHSNASPWTTGEIFEALEQKKLIVPFKIDDSQYNKKFRMMVRPLDFIEYYANPEIAFDSLLKTINICKKKYDERIAEEARRKAEEDARQHRAEIIEEIKVEALDFQHHVFTIMADAQKILEKQKQIGNIEKKCPVCSTQQPIENVYCRKCGWTFNPVFDEKPKGDKDHLFVMRSLWNTVWKSDAMKKELENKIQEQASVIEEKDVETELLRTETQGLAEERTRLSNDVSALQSELNGKNKEISALQSKLTASENNCVKLSSELKNYQDKELREQQAKEEAARFKDRTFTVNGVTFEMVAVKGGTFTMGGTSEQGSDTYDYEKPTHSVTLGGYYIGKFEVTQELWEAVMGSNPSYSKGSNRPVERVSWYEAVEFCNRLSEETGRRPYYSIDKERKDPNNENEDDNLKWTVRVNPDADGFRLPTEAEWEYAARGGVKSRGYKYSGSNSISEVAWYNDNSGSKTHAVGTKSPNELGIYDMSGNVYEWCQDWYGSYGSGSQTNPQGASSGLYRVLRGGGCYINAGYCRVSNRFNYNPDYGFSIGGLRLAL